MISQSFHYQPRFHESDSYGIIHHSAYFCWFEEGRTRLLEGLGVTLDELEYLNIQIVLQNITAQFLKPIQGRITIEIFSSLVLPVNGRLKFRHVARCPLTKSTYASAEIEAVARDVNGPTSKLNQILNQKNERESHAS